MSTTHDRYTLKTRAMAFVALFSAITLMMPMAPASADPGAFVVAGQAALTGGLGTTGSGCFAGHAIGVHGGPVVSVPLVDAPNATANVQSYDNTNLVLGDANGTLTIQGQTVNFTWLRVGATAVLFLEGGGHQTGAAVAAFVPTTTIPNPALPSCMSGAGLYATVAGVGVII